MKKRVLAAALALALLLPLLATTASAEPVPSFRLAFELYQRGTGPPGQTDQLEADPTDTDANGNPLTKVPEGRDFIVALRFDGLQNAGAGVKCLSVSFTYDSEYLEPRQFETPEEDGEAVLWTDAGKTFSNGWAMSPLSSGGAYVVNASDRPVADPGGRETLREIYIQYVAQVELDANGDPVLDTDGTPVRKSENILRDAADQGGYLGAFKFRPKKAIEKADGVLFQWSDYQIGVFNDASDNSPANTTDYHKSNLETSGFFETPVLKQIKTVTAQGVTVTGSIYSYNRYKDITIEFYLMSDISKSATPTLSEIRRTDITPVVSETIAGEKRSSTSRPGLISVPFEINGVPADTYQLRIQKPGHLTTYINHLSIDDDLNLSTLMSELNNGKTFTYSGHESEITLPCGQLDEISDRIDFGDRGVILDDRYFRASYNAANQTWGYTSNGEAIRGEADLDGDGKIDFGDRGVILDSKDFNVRDTDCMFDAS